MPSPRLILASASPRRQSLLREAGYSFLVHPANIDEENTPPGLTPEALARHLALAKVQTVAVIYPDDVTLGADTVVAAWDRTLGKPRDAEDARRMLSLLSGTRHRVISGVAVVHPAANFECCAMVSSIVQMRYLSAQAIDHYVASGQWQGKAGGYGIQDPDPFVTDMSGSLTNIVGLPMEVTTQLLSSAGIFPVTHTMP